MVIIKEITNEEILFCIIMIMIMSLLLILGYIIPIIYNKIHSSYHKGYNEANKDRINYFKTINDLKVHFNEIFSLIKNRDGVISIETTCLLVDYEAKLDKYEHKYYKF